MDRPELPHASWNRPPGIINQLNLKIPISRSKLDPVSYQAGASMLMPFRLILNNGISELRSLRLLNMVSLLGDGSQLLPLVDDRSVDQEPRPSVCVFRA